ncbi:hypothetical protein A1Q2_05276 [Trichosporon asahii var. asahii CBS 8904]|uniref:Uncharacterized protein n=1 Tax=Trichosporon asahii var. asahii (strain CBS 8904) TaxID=1220162 RepID=K1WFU3_TRIAC|nr:hypothetical protein A1Q2_05276 [Trichosporon asahii var. asahii CBS 8904]
MSDILNCLNICCETVNGTLGTVWPCYTRTQLDGLALITCAEGCDESDEYGFLPMERALQLYGKLTCCSMPTLMTAGSAAASRSPHDPLGHVSHATSSSLASEAAMTPTAKKRSSGESIRTKVHVMLALSLVVVVLA